VWRETQDALVHQSCAVDLPGRADRPADITTVTIDAAAESVAADVRAAVDGDVVLVAHSAGGIVLPAVASRLGHRVKHLVFVAGLIARDGELTLETWMPGGAAHVAGELKGLRERHGPCSLETIDIKTAAAIDSLNLSSQTVTWSGVPELVGRTFIRCLRDPIQPRELQARLAANCGASDVRDIDTGHTPAVEAPALLAALLDEIVHAIGGDLRRPPP
jgi:pimeloyl-ACP methyl ester carboxylesterase